MNPPTSPSVNDSGNVKRGSRAVFSLGSNLGDSRQTLGFAVASLAKLENVELREVSSIYHTKAVGELDQPDFRNLVVIADVALEPTRLLYRTQEIERVYGRVRDPDIAHGPRTLDIDIICIGSFIAETDELTLPHPRAHLRAFVLVPWLEIDPQAVLPQGKVVDLVAQMDLEGVRREADILNINY